MKKLLFVILIFVIVNRLQAQVIYVTPYGSGLKDGTSWGNSLDGNSAALSGYTRLAEAIKAASSGNVFWIGEGTYFICTDNDRKKYFEMGQGIKLYGGFQGTESDTTERNIALHPTIFSGDIGVKDNSTDNNYNLLILNPDASISSDSSVIDGIKLEKGYSNGTVTAVILVNSNTKARFSNVEAINNYAQGNGGVLKINSGAHVFVTNCSFSDNSGCGVYNQGDLLLSDCNISRNTNASGFPGVFNADSLVLNNCRIESNTNDFHNDPAGGGGGLGNAVYCSINGGTINGNKAYIKAGGIWNQSGSELWISGCNISGNSCDSYTNASGGGIYNQGKLNISGSDIAYNSSKLHGGGVINYGTFNIEGSLISNNSTGGNGGGLFNPTIVKNCVIVNNKRGNYYRGGGVYIGTPCDGIFSSTIMNNSGEGVSSVLTDTISMVNSILYGNEAQYSGNFKFTSSCVSGIAPVNGNISNNPRCVSPTAGIGPDYDGTKADWSLWGCSACVNRGKNSLISASDTVDAWGNPRIFAGTVDIGAMELQDQAFDGDCPPGISHNIEWEIFKPRPDNIQETTGAPLKSVYLETLETELSDDLSSLSRIRGYILPPRSGYYKFYMASDPYSSFYLSTDSSEINKRLILSTRYVNYTWPSSVSNTDSLYLESGRQYYFEAFCTGWYWNNCCSPWIKTLVNGNYLKIGWAMPASSKLEVIGSLYVRQARPKQRTGVNIEIFRNLISYDFNNLKNTNEIPDEVNRLDSLITADHSTSMDHYASRIRGYLLPPVRGIYSFYFACDNAGQFWLSSDSSSSGAQLKSEITHIQTDWTNNISTGELTAGRKYFFEILHYDTIYTDLIKMGWKIPGKSAPEVIKTPYITDYEAEYTANSFSFIDKEIIAYPKWTVSPLYYLTPWNSNNKSLKWESSNNSVASVNADGMITMIGPGECLIIASAAGNHLVSDTLHLTVTDYYGPYFVKASALPGGHGHSWDDAIPMTKLLDILKQGQPEKQLSIFVAEGIYKPTSGTDRNKTFLMNNVRIKGGFDYNKTGTDTLHRNYPENETILSGDIGIPTETIDNSYHVVDLKGKSVIDGFIIRDGRASCSTEGWTPGVAIAKKDDNGGGIFIEGPVSVIANCKITNNSAWNGGGGIYSGSSTVYIKNCTFYANMTRQITIIAGGMFEIIVNGYGAGICASYSNIFINDSYFHDNVAKGYAGAIYLKGATVNIENSTFSNNPGSNSYGFFAGTSSKLILNNSTVKDNIYCFTSPYAKISNTTIIGNLGSSSDIKKEGFSFDNSIVSGFDPSSVPDSALLIRYSIIGLKQYGTDKSDIISSGIPGHSQWLDTISYNGGATPTMKLKKVPGNPAISYGNPVYLGTTDQRGALRTDSVSIGSYQYVKASGIKIEPGLDTLCQGETSSFRASVLPAFAADTSFTVASTDTTVIKITGSVIYASGAGKAGVVVRTVTGSFSDTCHISVNPVPFRPVILQSAFRLFSDALTGNQWYSSSGSIAGATGQNFDPQLDGDYYVKITTGGCSSEPSNIIHFISTGIMDENVANKVKIYPNPFTDELLIEFPGSLADGSYEIMNFAGEVVTTGKLTGRTTVKTGGLSRGAYILKVTIGNDQCVKKIIKQ